MINSKVKEKIDLIENIAHKYYETIYSTVSDEQLNFFKKWYLKNCNKEKLPDDYLDTVSLINGFDFNGLSIYSIDVGDDNNIYDTNEIYWENTSLKKYLFIGEDSISWYCKSLVHEKYYVLDKPSGSIVNKFFNFNDLILVALESIE